MLESPIEDPLPPGGSPIRDFIFGQDLLAKDRGMTYKVVAWVHPEFGDDIQRIWYFRVKPSGKDIKVELKRQGSTVFTDYQLSQL